MATEDILIRYRADVSQLEADINKVIASQEELTAATKANTTEQTKAANSAEFAAKKRAQLLELEVQKLKQLQQAQKLAFDPKEIEKYNQQIAATQRNVALLGDTYQKEAAQINQANQQIQNSNEGILNGINRIGAAFGVAFTAEALIQFAQQSVRAFLEAEEQANKLRFAVTSIGGEGEEALARLNAQAQQLADTTFFDDDDITAAQAALSAFGLTADQIEEIVPKLADFAAVTGGTVTEAANTLGGALEGRAGEFKRFGIEVDAASTKAENLAAVSKGLAAQVGAAGDALGTAAGQAKVFARDAGQAQEDIGQGIVFYVQEFTKFLKELVGPAIDAISNIGRLLANLIPQPVIDKIKELTGDTNALGVAFKVINAPIVLLIKGLTFLLEKLVQVGATVGGVVNVFRVGFKEIADVATNVGGGIADVIEGIADFDATKIKAGFNKVKGAFSKAGEDIAKAFNQGYDKVIDLTKATADEAGKAAQAGVNAEQKLFTSGELRKKQTSELIKLQKEYQKDTTNFGRQQLEAIDKEIEARKKSGEASKKAGEDAKKQAEEFRKFIASIDTEIAKLQADLERRKIEVIPADSQKAQEDRIKALADLNEKAINDEIAAKIKLVQDDAKLSEAQKQEAIKKYEELKQARLDLAQFNEQNELNIINAQQVKRIEDAAKQIDDLNIEQALVIEADKVESANEAVAKSFEDLGKAISKADFEAAKEAATARTAALNQALNDELNINKTRIENARDAELAKVKEGEAADEDRAAINLKYDNQILNQTKQTNDKIAENNAELNNQITTNTERATEARIAQTFEVLNATQQLIGELSSLYAQFSEQRIGEIEAERDAQLESIEAQLTQNEEYLEQRRISEEEAAAQEKALIAEREKIEAAAQKKIREEKRKQAVLDKANALFQIALNTAIALTGPDKITNPFLIALVLATSALQAAAVAAQPIPYRKGSKDTGAKGHMARVGEEGEEIVYMPGGSKVLPAKQTRRYGEVIDAMFDNRLDDYIYKNYITPALVAQNEKKEGARAKNFADNLAKSIIYNQPGLTASDLEAQRKRGQYIRNVDELADAIAKKIPTRDIYRA